MNAEDAMEISKLVRRVADKVRNQRDASKIRNISEYVLELMIEHPTRNMIEGNKRAGMRVLDYAFKNNIVIKGPDNNFYEVKENSSAFDPYSLKRKIK